MTPKYKDPHKEHKACRGCKVLESTDCEIASIVDTWEQISGKEADFRKCQIRPFAIKLLKIEPKKRGKQI